MEDAFPCMLDGVNLAMDRLFRLHDFRTEQPGDRLMPKTDAQNRDNSCEASDDIQTDARFI